MAIFGYQNIGIYTASIASTTDGDFIVGAVFTISENGTADSITCAIRGGVGTAEAWVRCAIYKHSDLSFVGETAARWIYFNKDFTWETFIFGSPKPELTSGTEYVLVAWAHYVDTVLRIAVDVSGRPLLHAQNIEWNSFPDPLVPYHLWNIVSIYCTYTPTVVPKPPISNIIPLMKGMDLIGMVKPFSKRFPKLSPLVIK